MHILLESCESGIPVVINIDCCDAEFSEAFALASFEAKVNPMKTLNLIDHPHWSLPLDKA